MERSTPLRARPTGVGGIPRLEAKGHTTAPGLDLDTLYGQLLRRMPNHDERAARFVVLVPEVALDAALRVPERVRSLLRIEVYAVTAEGQIRRG